MARVERFFLRLTPKRSVGPHSLNQIREWVHFEVIPATTEAQKQGEQTWTSITDIPNFYDYPEELRAKLAQCEQPHWWHDSVTEKQIQKLDYFKIPYSTNGLTKGRASQLLDYFEEIDPEREKSYQKRPPTASQRKRLQSLGYGGTKELTYSEARDLIEDREQEEEADLMILENSVNDEEWRELLGYKKLSTTKLKALHAYIREHPEYKDAYAEQLGELAMHLFPELRKKEKVAAARKTKPKGCLFTFIVLAAFLILKLSLAQ